MLWLFNFSKFYLNIQNQISSRIFDGGFHNTNIWYMIWNAGLVVQCILVLLGLFSIISWSIIIAKKKIIYDVHKENREFEEIFWRSESLSVVFNQSKHLVSSSLVALFRLGYAEIGKVFKGQNNNTLLADNTINKVILNNLSRALNRGQAVENIRLAQTVIFLATIANTAPFIGLFGTVWGIMDSFRSIGTSGAASLAIVAPGIAEALVTTAAGLFAAIPAVVFYNYFNHRFQVLENEMNSFVQDFLNLVERDLIYHISSISEKTKINNII